MLSLGPMLMMKFTRETSKFEPKVISFSLQTEVLYEIRRCTVLLLGELFLEIIDTVFELIDI